MASLPPPFGPCSSQNPSHNRSAILPTRSRSRISADRAGCLSSRRSCDDNRRAGNHARLAAHDACRHWRAASSSTIDNACADAAAPQARDARDHPASASLVYPRYRTAMAEVRQTARSSARPIEIRLAASARTMRRRNCRNHVRPPHRSSDSRTPTSGRARRAPD